MHSSSDLVGVTAVSSETPLDSAKTYPASDPVNGRSSGKDEGGASAPTKSLTLGSLSDIVGGALKGLSGVGPAATSTGESPKVIIVVPSTLDSFSVFVTVC